MLLSCVTMQFLSIIDILGLVHHHRRKELAFCLATEHQIGCTFGVSNPSLHTLKTISHNALFATRVINHVCLIIAVDVFSSTSSTTLDSSSRYWLMVSTSALFGLMLEHSLAVKLWHFLNPVIWSSPGRLLVNIISA